MSDTYERIAAVHVSDGETTILKRKKYVKKRSKTYKNKHKVTTLRHRTRRRKEGQQKHISKATNEANTRPPGEGKGKG